MIHLAQKNNIQLILVRTKHLTYPTEASEPLALREYMQKFKAYAAQNNITVLDFAHDERLTPDLFADSHHLTEAGKAVFTEMLAEALKLILSK
jgi:lysophospholipase L1-like esterase